MKVTQPAGVVFVIGGQGAGKTTLVRNLESSLDPAIGLSGGWWIRGLIGWVLTLARTHPDLERLGLYECARRVSLPYLAENAARLGFRVEGETAWIGDRLLDQPTEADMLAWISEIQAVPEVRRYLTSEILAWQERLPATLFVIDVRGGANDWTGRGRRSLHLYLRAHEDVAAARKGVTPKQILARDNADRNRAVWALPTPGPGDLVLDTDERTPEEVRDWAIQHMIEAGLLSNGR